MPTVARCVWAKSVVISNLAMLLQDWNGCRALAWIQVTSISVVREAADHGGPCRMAVGHMDVSQMRLSSIKELLIEISLLPLARPQSK